MKKTLILIIFYCFIQFAFAQSFDAFVNHLKQQAREQGFKESTINTAFHDVKLLKRAVKKNRHQSRHVKHKVNPQLLFKHYLKISVNNFRIKEGKLELDKHQALLNEISRQYKVPKQFIVSLWGLETNYGRYMGHYPEFSALTSLAYDSWRRSLFTKEIFSALQMLQEKKIPIEKMKGSWAGAMGQCQFMPRAYMRFAVAYKHKGHADIWHHIPDVFASIANYLHSEGWNEQYPFLYQVKLEKPISRDDLGLRRKHDIHYWIQKGVRTLNHQPLAHLKGEYSLLMPGGKKGPAFLVNWTNFRVIMRWNSSTFYALSVGVLAKKLQ